MESMGSKVTSSVMIREGRLPSFSGGMREPLRDEGPEPGARDPLREPSLSFEISTFGGSTSFGAPGAA